MKLFIAGCARSGTTLTHRLMRCFEDVFIFPKEASFRDFPSIDRQEKIHVIKRTAFDHKRLQKLPADIGLIYCLRHPFDVLTSPHRRTLHLRRFHVTPDRWEAEYAALLRLRKAQRRREIFYSRYEDLVREPDEVQARMSRFFDLTQRIRFTEDSDNQVHSASVGKWRQNDELLSYVYGLEQPFLKRVEGFCEEFGYTMPSPIGAHN